MNSEYAKNINTNVIKKIFPNSLTLYEYFNLITIKDSVDNDDNNEELLANFLTNHDNNDKIYSNYLINKDDTQAFYQHCCDDVYIVPEEQPIEQIKLSIIKSESSINEQTKLKDILNRIISQLVKSNKNFKEQNVLQLGYRKRSEFSSFHGEAGMRNHQDLECYIVNSIHTLLLSSPSWRLTSSRVGELAIKRILSRYLSI
jgi:hypothetical protein